MINRDCVWPPERLTPLVAPRDILMSEYPPPLAAILAQLPETLQQEVYDFALFLLQTRVPPPERWRKAFYICPVCFETSPWPAECHDHPMIPCHPDRPEDCQPVRDAMGHLQARAPRWFIQAVSRGRGG